MGANGITTMTSLPSPPISMAAPQGWCPIVDALRDSAGASCNRLGAPRDFGLSGERDS